MKCLRWLIFPVAYFSGVIILSAKNSLIYYYHCGIQVRRILMGDNKTSVSFVSEKNEKLGFKTSEPRRLLFVERCLSTEHAFGDIQRNEFGILCHLVVTQLTELINNVKLRQRMRRFNFNFALGIVFRIFSAFVLKLVTMNQTVNCFSVQMIYTRDMLCFIFRVPIDTNSDRELM